MKCLSIRQPWAFFVCVGVKSIENRSWNTQYRGEVAIHAGSNAKAVDDFMELEIPDATVVGSWFSFGAIIGIADLYDARPISESIRSDPWAEGPFCLMLRNQRLFRIPIPHKGRVNLCELPVAVAKQVEEHKRDSLDVEANGLRELCARAIPTGNIPKSLLGPAIKK